MSEGAHAAGARGGSRGDSRDGVDTNRADFVAVGASSAETGPSRPLGRLLAIDYGSRRIGMAVSDALGITTRPLGAIDRRREPDVMAALAERIAAEEAIAVVVGLPRHDDGRLGAVAAPARALAGRLAAELRRRHGEQAPPVYMHDESATSSEARARLQATGRLRRRADGRPADKGAIDAAAAAVLLERFLAEGRESGAPPLVAVAPTDSTALAPEPDEAAPTEAADPPSAVSPPATNEESAP